MIPSETSNYDGLYIEPLKDEDEWEHFVRNSHAGTFFHTLKWKKLLEAVFHYDTIYLVIRESNGALVGIFPFILRREFRTILVLDSLPYSDYAGPLLKEGLAEKVSPVITNYLEEIAKRIGVTYAQIRFSDKDSSRLFSSVKGQIDVSAGTMMVDMEEMSTSDIWNKSLNSNRRRQIRLLEKNGFQLRTCASVEDLKHFYDLYCLNMNYLDVYHFPFSFFSYAFESLFPDSFNIILMEKNNQSFAGAGFYIYEPKKTIYQTLIGIDRNAKYPGLPFIYLTWGMYKWAERFGYRYVSLGATPSDPNTTYHHLKERIGGKFNQDYYFFYPFNRTKYRARSVAITLWQHIGKKLPKKFTRGLVNIVKGS